jgi:AbrB family looped-hinge helix DNA binding protein
MKASVSEQGQVTIPKEPREKLGIRPGAILELSEENGRLVAVRATEDPVEDVYGILDLGRSTDEYLEEVRGPADTADQT